jgi:hypothetical protein
MDDWVGKALELGGREFFERTGFAFNSNHQPDASQIAINQT